MESVGPQRREEAEVSAAYALATKRKEQIVAAHGAYVGEFDICFRNAGSEELLSVRFPEIEVHVAITACKAHIALRKCRSGGVDVRLDLVAAGPGAWADAGQEFFRFAGTFLVHPCNELLRKACHRATPTRMGQTEHASNRVVDQYERAVGREAHQWDGRSRGEDAVALLHWPGWNLVRDMLDMRLVDLNAITQRRGVQVPVTQHVGTMSGSLSGAPILPGRDIERTGGKSVDQTRFLTQTLELGVTPAMALGVIHHDAET